MSFVRLCYSVEPGSQDIFFYNFHNSALRFNGSRAILSGPAGGVVGYAMTSFNKETGLPVIGMLDSLIFTCCNFRG